MKYTVKTYNDWTHPYFYSEGDMRPVRAKETCEQEVADADLVSLMVKDWLDVPAKEMTDDDVRREFDSDKRKLAAEYVEQIRNYYNGRLAMFRKFRADFENAKAGDRLRYDIPYELNHFETDPEDKGWVEAEKQHEAYFEVSIED